MKARHPLFALVCAATALAFVLAAPASAKSKKPPKTDDKAAAAAAAAGAAGGAPGDKPYGDWKKLTKDAEVLKGYFTAYKKRENLYLEIRPEQFGTPILGIFSFARGIGSNFLLGGLPLGDHLLEFQRAGDHVLVLEQNTRFVASGDSAFDKARDLSYGNSVLASLKVESVQDSTKSVLVDLATFLVSDVSDLAEGMRGALGGKSVRFDKDRSALGKAKMFPENFEAEATLTYSPNDRTNYGLATVSDDRFIPITVHYSFTKLPAVPMQPRLADSRTGYFLTVVKDYSRDTEDDYFRRYINRWRLEKKDPTAALSEPVKPIIYYLDKTIPVEYRPYIKQGIEGWSKAFEAAGFKNAIQAKDAPDDPNWDPEDARYSTIRWIVSSEPAFGAIGPSRVDPRTGEILDADILVEGSIVQRRLQVFRRLGGTVPSATEAFSELVQPSLRPAPSFLPQDARCDEQLGMAEGQNLLHIDMLANGDLPAGGPLPKEYIGEMLVHVTLHEVGHTLGLRHNFRSSTSTPYDKLQDKTWTQEHGLVSSVMDYSTPNLAADRSHQGYYYADDIGDCDRWMIRYGYAPSGAADPDADYDFAKKIADESTQPGHEYSTDEDTYPADALDPRTNIWDLGDDPLKFGKERATYVAGLWRNPKFEERMVGPGGEYSSLRHAMDDLLGQYAIALGMGVKYVGGQYYSRSHRGQPAALAPFTPVPAAKQREALDFLGQRAFAADAFQLSPELLNCMGPDRWSHWGVPSTFGERQDYNFGDRSLALQSALMNALTAPALLARVREAESHSTEPYRLSEHFDRLTKMLWGEVGGENGGNLKAIEGTGTRRLLQRNYVDRLATMVVSPAPGTPDDARALARLQLTRIDGRASRVLAGKAPLGDYTRAHLIETRARIKRALEAGRDVPDPRPAGPGGPGAVGQN